MYRLALLAVIPILASEALPAASSWPSEYCFFGRWDLRAPRRAVTVSSGSYVRARFSGGGLAASFDLSLNQRHCTCTPEGSFPTIAWQIDGGKWQEAELAPVVSLADGLTGGKHTVMLMVRGLDEHQSRWTPPLVASVTFTGLVTDKRGGLEKALPEWKEPTLSIEFFGDSITEGVLVNEGRAGAVPGVPRTWPWLSDARLAYASQTAMKLGAEWRQVGFGATGLKRTGSGGVPGALETFDFFYAGCPRDSWKPDLVVVNQGSNEASMPADEYQPLYTRYLAVIRKAYPRAKIVALRPLNGSQESSIRAAVDARKAAGDSDLYYIDSSGWYDGPIHPNVEDSALLAEKLASVLKSDVLSEKVSR